MTATLDDLILASHNAQGGPLPFDWVVEFASGGNLQRVVDEAWAEAYDPHRMLDLWERDKRGWRKAVYQIAGAIGATERGIEDSLRVMFQNSVKRGRAAFDASVRPRSQEDSYTAWKAWNALDSGPAQATNYVHGAITTSALPASALCAAIRRIRAPQAAAIGLRFE